MVSRDEQNVSMGTGASPLDGHQPLRPSRVARQLTCLSPHHRRCCSQECCHRLLALWRLAQAAGVARITGLDHQLRVISRESVWVPNKSGDFATRRKTVAQHLDACSAARPQDQQFLLLPSEAPYSWST